jgi:hypothetical protein
VKGGAWGYGDTEIKKYKDKEQKTNNKERIKNNLQNVKNLNHH